MQKNQLPITFVLSLMVLWLTMPAGKGGFESRCTAKRTYQPHCTSALDTEARDNVIPKRCLNVEEGEFDNFIAASSARRFSTLPRIAFCFVHQNDEIRLPLYFKDQSPRPPPLS